MKVLLFLAAVVGTAGCGSTIPSPYVNTTQLSPIPITERVIATQPTALVATAPPVRTTVLPEGISLTVTVTTPAVTTLNLPPTSTSIPVSGEISLELVTQRGGSLRSIMLAGDILYAGQGPRLVVLDVTTPTDPRFLSHSDVLPGLVENIITVDETLYLTAGRMLMRFDLSDPLAPALRDQVELPAPGMIIVRGDVLYAAGLTAVDYQPEGDARYESYVATVALGEDLRVLAVTMVPAAVSQIALAGNILYVGQQNGPLLALDISDPTSLEEARPVPCCRDSFSLKVYGSTLLSGGYYELTAYNISHPLAPEQLWRQEGPDLAQVYEMAVYQDRLYTAGWQAAGSYIPASAMILLDEPLPPPSYLAPVRDVGLLATDNYLYLLDGHLAVRALVGSEVGHYIPSTGGDVAVGLGMVYVATRGGTSLSGGQPGRVEAYRLPDLERFGRYVLPTEGRMWLPELYTITYADSYLYLTSDGELRILDARSLERAGLLRPPAPENENSPFLFQQVWRSVTIPVVGNWAYAYSAPETPVDSAELIVPVNISDPEHPILLDSLPIGDDWRIGDMAASGQWLVAATYDTTPNPQDELDPDRLLLYDLSGAAPALVAEMNAALSVTDVQIAGDLMLVGSGSYIRQGALTIFRLPDLTPIASLTVPAIHEIVVSGNLAFITTRADARLLVMDLGDPAHPEWIGAFDLPLAGADLVVSGDFIVASSGSMGIFVLGVNR